MLRPSSTNVENASTNIENEIDQSGQARTAGSTTDAAEVAGIAGDTPEAYPIEAKLADDDSANIDAMVEERIKQRMGDIEVAEVASKKEDESLMFQIKKVDFRKIALIALAVIVVIIVVVLVVVFINDDNDTNDTDNNATEETHGIQSFRPTLEEIKERGYLLCGAYEFAVGFSFHNETSGQFEGFLVDIVS